MILDSRDTALLMTKWLYRKKNDKRAYHAHTNINDIFHLGFTD